MRNFIVTFRKRDIRLLNCSSLIPNVICSISALTLQQILAIPLMKLAFVAKNALKAYLIISALRISVL